VLGYIAKLQAECMPLFFSFESWSMLGSALHFMMTCWQILLFETKTGAVRYHSAVADE